MTGTHQRKGPLLKRDRRRFLFSSMKRLCSAHAQKKCLSMKAFTAFGSLVANARNSRAV